MKKFSPIKSLHELATTKIWWMQSDALNMARKAIIDAHNNLDVVASDDYDDEDNECDDDIEVNTSDPHSKQVVPREINIMHVERPIVRNDAYCGRGSIQFKERMIKKADDNVIGHIVIINSPGGSALSIFDYKDAINYARGKKQPVIAFVKGMACSAAYALAALCDKIICYSDHDEVGSIGAMAAFYVTPDKAKNSITEELYREVYADASPDKNIEIRAAANDDIEPIKKLVNQSADDFRQMLTECRPSVTEQQKTGLNFFAKDVIGSMVDAIGDFKLCVDTILQSYEDNLLQQRKSGTLFKSNSF